MSTLLDVVLLVTVLLTASCKGYVTSGKPSSILLKNVTERYWMWKLEQFPGSATARGINAFDDRLEEFSLQVVEERKNEAVGVLRRLEDISRADLSDAEVHTLGVLQADLNYYIEGYEYRLYGYLNPVSFLEGPHRRLSWINHQPATTEADYDKLTRRYKALVRQIDQLIALMTEAVRLNRTNHKVSMQAVVETIDQFYNRPVAANESVFYTPFQAKEKLLIDRHTWAAIRTEGIRLTEDVQLAYKRLRDFIENVYMRSTRPGYGVGSLPGGLQYYEACLRFHLTMDITALEVRDIGLREVARIKALMEQIMRREGFHGTLPQFFQHLRTVRWGDFFGRSDDELLQSYRRIINEVIPPKLSTVLKNIPDDPIWVKPMGVDGLAGMYRPVNNGGIFYANMAKAETRPTFTQMALALHETNPGHHLQVMYSRRQSVPEFRRHLCCLRYSAVPLTFQWYSAYTEGWGLYAEYLGEEMGCYNTSTLELFGRYSYEMFRACRLVVDTGIHVYGWSRDRAIDYLTNHTAMPRSQAAKEVDRYITWPGQACSYKIGEIAILRLRHRAQRVLGSSFDLREFNERILSTGRVPLYLLEREIDQWLRQTRARPLTSASSRLAIDSLSFTLVISVFSHCLVHSLIYYLGK